MKDRHSKETHSSKRIKTDIFTSRDHFHEMNQQRSDMFLSSDKFLRIQQSFKMCTPFEQLCTTIELTRSLQISYQHFLIQLFQINIKNENDIMFNHTVENANSPDIVSCLRTTNLDKILHTIQLYLPLISNDTFDEKLFNAYRDILMHLDANLSPKKFTYHESQLISFAQQIYFYLQMNRNLHKLLNCIPKLIHLVQTENFFPEEPQQQQPQIRQPLQRFGSARPQVPSLMSFSSEGAQNLQIPQQLKRNETGDSGVDLSEPVGNNFFTSHHSKHPTLDRHSSATTNASQRKHLFVGKTASAPIPEHASIDTPARVPLAAALSAPPASSNQSDSRQKTSPNGIDHVEQESQNSIQRLVTEGASASDLSRPLGPFFSQRYRNVKTPQTDNVSQYLGVETNSAPEISTFNQPNSGMKDVQRWLKQLRLHKYDVFFSQLTYDEMMNLTGETLRDSHITEGACTKILLNIKKLKERSVVLEQYLSDYSDGKIDLPTLISQLNEMMNTPIRSKQLAKENNSDEDIPQSIIDVLEKIFQQLPSYATPDVYHNLLLYVDRCYKHEAFSEYAHLFLQWRRRLSNILQSFGPLDFKSVSFSSNHPNQTRRSGKPPVRPMRSTTNLHQPTSVSLSKYNSEPQNNYYNESTYNRHPTRSPPHLSSTYEEPSSEINSRTINSPNNQGAYLSNQNHQPLSRKASIIPSSVEHKMKLCKTHSDPHKVRLQNASQSMNRPPQNLVRMISNPYSHQPRQFVSRSPPSSMMDALEVPAMKKCHSDNERSTDDISLLPEVNTDDQEHHVNESDLFCRQIANNAIGDDANDCSMDYGEASADVATSKQPSNNCTDMEDW